MDKDSVKNRIYELTGDTVISTNDGTPNALKSVRTTITKIIETILSNSMFDSLILISILFFIAKVIIVLLI